MIAVTTNSMSRHSRGDLYTEYGSFSRYVQAFLKAEIEAIQKQQGRPLIILDPMAGTAPLIPFVEKSGCIAVFNDLNPVHMYVNKAKLYDVFQSYRAMGYDQCLHMMAGLANGGGKSERGE